MLRACLIATALTCIPAAYLAGQPTPDAGAPVAEAVQAQMERWLAAYEAQDAKTLAGVFMDDGIYAANTGQVLRGRSAIREGVAAWFAKSPAAKVDIRRNQLRFRMVDGMANELSRFTIHVVGPDCIIDAGHALSVWRREADDQWRIETLLVNQDRERPSGACN
jgi:uncharacterized protein (TIGR02246 family)